MSYAPPPMGPPPSGYGPPGGYGPPPPAGYGPPPGSHYGPPPPGHHSPPPPGHHAPPPPHHQHSQSFGGLPPGGAPSPGHSLGGFTIQDTVGTFEGVSYKIDHRDSNSILTLNLQPGYSCKGKSGSMVTMQASVQIKGKFSFSFKKMMTGGDMAESTYTGPGEVVLAPEVWADIVPIQITPGSHWSVGKDAFLACTPNVVRETKSQGLGKAFLSGEGFWVGKISGHGVLFVQSLGAIIKRTLGPGEQLIVDNGHLVCWSASYSMERINTTGGGLLSGSHTGEGLVCRFTGPGDVYIQTRNPTSIGAWIAAQVPKQGGSGGGGGSLLGAMMG